MRLTGRGGFRETSLTLYKYRVQSGLCLSAHHSNNLAADYKRELRRFLLVIFIAVPVLAESWAIADAASKTGVARAFIVKTGQSHLGNELLVFLALKWVFFGTSAHKSVLLCFSAC